MVLITALSLQQYPVIMTLWFGSISKAKQDGVLRIAYCMKNSGFSPDGNGILLRQEQQLLKTKFRAAKDIVHSRISS